MSKELVISLFEPSKRDMKLDYPELADVEEFEELNARELKFCWYVGNRTSPLAKLDKKIRVVQAAETAFEGYRRDKSMIDGLRKGIIPSKLKLAIAKMTTYVPTVRLRAKLNTEYIFEAMQDLVIIDKQTRKNMTGDEKKEYQALLSKVSADLPKLVDRIEGGFGIKIVEKNNRKAEVKISLKDVLSEIDQD
jgi:hypothetical protein